MNLTSIALLSAAVIIIIVLWARLSSVRRKDADGAIALEQKLASLKAQASTKEEKIRALSGKLERLNELNDRYLAFVLKVPEINKRLNATLKLEDIIRTIAGLVNDIISTDVVELYVLSDNSLRRVYPEDAGGREVQYALGEGLVGRAGRDGVAKIKGLTDKGIGLHYDKAEEKLWMAVPIRFQSALLGAIAVGQVKNPAGTERELLNMVSDIAGVALINQEILDGAQKEAITDPLTGLYNRRYFFDVAQKAVIKSAQDGTPLSFFMFDIDNFKRYNDANGHPEGDRLLKELSELIQSVTRKTACIARYGGEEFIVMLPATSKNDAFVYADRFREKIEAYPFAHKERQPGGVVSISGGIAGFPEDGSGVQELIKAADGALYRAKNEGRNRVLAG